MPNNLNVSCKALIPYLDAFPEWDERHAPQFGKNLAYLRDTANMLPWQEFIQFLRLFVDIHGLEKLRESQRQSIEKQQGSAMRVLGMLASPKVLYKLYTRWVTPTIFPCLSTTIIPVSDSKTEILLEIPAPECETFIEAQKTLLEYLPTLI